MQDPVCPCNSLPNQLLCAVSMVVSELKLLSASEIKGCSCKVLQLGTALLHVQWLSEVCLNFGTYMLTFNSKLVFGMVFSFLGDLMD